MLRVRFASPFLASASSLLTSFLTAIFAQPPSPDVCLVFPRAENLRLYTHKALLTASSPYFVDLFSSGFSESAAKPSAKRRKVEMPDKDAIDYEDADDETDKLVLKEKQPPSPLPPSAAMHEVTITDAAYTTYRALLLFLQTGYIDWAPPLSLFRSLPEEPDKQPASHDNWLKSRVAASGIDVFPSSHKSMYRLAHLLALDSLRDLALKVFNASLDPSTAALELVSPVVLLYDELRQAVVDFIANEFEEVEQSKAWREVMDRVKRGEANGTAPALAELLEAKRALGQSRSPSS